jgi:hypothetical protein
VLNGSAPVQFNEKKEGKKKKNKETAGTVYSNPVCMVRSTLGITVGQLGPRARNIRDISGFVIQASHV